MQLFDTFTRTNLEPAKYADSDFDFYNDSAWPQSEKIRTLLENWFSLVPDENKEELSARFKSKAHFSFNSVFFELFIFSLLKKMNCDITFHPEVPNSTSRPDFLAISQAGRRSYVECAVDTTISRTQASKEKNLQTLFDYVNTIKSRYFFLRLDIEGAPASSPPVSKLKKDLEKWLEGLDHQKILNSNEVQDKNKFVFIHDGCQIVFYPLPKKIGATDEGRSIGMFFHGAKMIYDIQTIRETMEDKAKKYGSLEEPYIVAINCMTPFKVDRLEIFSSMFGDQKVTWVQKSDGTHETFPGRALNGAWLGPKGPRNKDVSGLLMLSGFSPSAVASSSAVLVHHPWAVKPYNDVFCQLPQEKLNFSNSKIESIQGMSIGDILGLPKKWPE